jgi:hypothetical protein
MMLELVLDDDARADALRATVLDRVADVEVTLHPLDVETF